jgi:SAM-dependent methyltransferase
LTTSKLAPAELTRLRNAFARLALQWMAAPSSPGVPAIFAPPFSSMESGDWREAVRLWLAHRSAILEESASRRCPGCDGAESRWLFESYDGYPYHECLSCGCWFVPLRIDGGTFERLFEASPEARALAARMMTGRDEAARRDADLARIGRYLDVLTPMLAVDGPVRYLDVGCGVGHSLRAGRGRGMRAQGVEVDSTARNLAIGDGLAVAGDLRELHPGQFDLISFWETLEHIADPHAALEAIVPVLSADGLVSITVPNLNAPAVRVQRAACAWIHGGYNTPGHLNMFNGNVLTRLLARAGLSVIHIEGQYGGSVHEVAAYVSGASRGAFDALDPREPLGAGLPIELVDAIAAVAPGLELIERLAVWSPIVWVTACRADRAGRLAEAMARRQRDYQGELAATARALMATEPDYKAISEDLTRHLTEVQRKYNATLSGRLDRWRAEGKLSFLRPLREWLGR